MNILALDVATKTGFAASSGESGVWDFKLKPDDSRNIRLVNFRNKVSHALIGWEINLVIFESTVNKKQYGNSVADELVGVLKVLCEDMGIDTTSRAPSQIKKFATGKGNADKTLMINTARSTFPYEKIIDDNHADAKFLLQLAEKEFNRTPVASG